MDSFPGIAATVDAVLTEQGYPPCDRAALRALIGAPLERIFATLVPELDRTPGAVPRAVAAYVERFPHLGVPGSPLFPGLLGVLDACRAAGLPLAVVTTKRTPVAIQVLDACGIAPYFGAVVGADATPRPKPDPEPAYVALQRLGLQRGAAGSATVVGDTEFDVGMARAAGCRSVAVGWGYRPVEALRAAGAGAVAASPSELHALLLPG